DWIPACAGISENVKVTAMFIIECPHCGPRDQAEFHYGGEAHRTRPTNSEQMSDAEWSEFLFMRTNTKGVFAERWNHAAGCRRWFNMLRNTATDEILAIYPMGTERPEISGKDPVTPCGEAPIGSGNDAAKIERDAPLTDNSEAA
ncbi:MAG TPA: sarcosine oxidase subunit delta, partial [Hyphomicrobiales bacterium]|nr:sarcosine oxidase subunit delta [Hyphomicrobiales bacterium]